MNDFMDINRLPREEVVVSYARSTKCPTKEGD